MWCTVFLLNHNTFTSSVQSTIETADIPPRRQFYWKSLQSRSVKEHSPFDKSQDTDNHVHQSAPPSKKQKKKPSHSTKPLSHYEAVMCINELQGNASQYHFRIDFQSLHRFHTSLSADIYQGYHFLCVNNKFMEPTCWVLCNYFQTGNCILQDALKSFDPNGGTSSLKIHYKTKHVERCDTVDLPKKVTSGVKQKVTDAAVLAVFQGMLPLNFTYRHPGMLQLASSLVLAGQ